MSTTPPNNFVSDRISNFVASREAGSAVPGGIETDSLPEPAIVLEERPTKRFSVPWFSLGTTVMVIGFVSLLASLNYLPDIHWVWVLSLLATGGVSLLWGLNKVSFVVAGMLFASAVGSVLRQTGAIKLNVEVPILIMIAGALVLVGMFLKLRSPDFVQRMRSC